MTSKSVAEVKCSKCKNVYEAEVIDHIDLSEDQDMIKPLKAGKANRVQCPKCKKVMYLDRSIVVNFEPENKIVVYDKKARSKAAKESLMEDYRSVISFNDILSEIAEETEFSIITKLDQLKAMLNEYVKVHQR
ncbi:MAG: CpXC domain-containing protein [Candidatus Thorarchaeota archaeon]